MNLARAQNTQRMQCALMLQMSVRCALFNNAMRMNSTTETKTMNEKLDEMTWMAPRLRLYEGQNVDRSFADSGQDLYINFVGPKATESEIKEMFSRFGIVMKVNLKPARDQFSSKCWVTMKS